MTDINFHTPPRDLPFVRQLTEEKFYKLKTYERFEVDERIKDRSIIRMPIRNPNVDLLIVGSLVRDFRSAVKLMVSFSDLNPS